MKNRLRIRMCVNFGAEAACVVRQFRGDGVELDLFPAACGSPQLKRADLCGAVPGNEEDFCRTVVLSGWCVAREDSMRNGTDRCRFHAFDQCFYLIAPQEMVDGYLSKGAYLLTPGWLHRWRQVLDEWGFGRETARQFFEESCHRLVLLDTGVAEESRAQLEAFAHFVARPFESVTIGLSHFRLCLEKVVLQWKLENQQDALREANRRSADYAMAYDLIAGLTKIKSEAAAIDDILKLFNMLFAPEQLSYVPVLDPEFSESPPLSSACWNSESVPDDLQDGLVLLEQERGFSLAISHNQEIVGMVKLAGVAFPQYLNHYISLASTMAKVCGLAISNARTYQAMKQNEEVLRHEIEQRKKAEDARRIIEGELLKLQKMEAVSVLAGGIAHDFNNLLGVVLGHITMAQMDVDSQDPAFKELDAAYQGTIRAGELVKQFLAISEGGILDIRRVDLRIMLPSVVASAKSSWNAVIELTIPNDLWPVEIDSSQISRTLRNILKNAMEATVSGQAIQVCAENVHIDSSIAGDGLSLIEPGPYVKISTIDRGGGIPKEHLSRIFDPYFSTKARGAQKGMGMGLTLAYSVIRKHNGFLRIESKNGEGTNVEIYLPALTQ